jgi:hypothetical protein
MWQSSKYIKTEIKIKFKNEEKIVQEKGCKKMGQWCSKNNNTKNSNFYRDTYLQVYAQYKWNIT